MKRGFIVISVVQEAGCKTRVGVDAAVAQERPPAAHLLAPGEVYVDALRGFGVGRGAVKEFALRTSHETAAPKLNASRGARWVGLVAYTVNGDYRQAVGYGVASLHGRPCLALPLFFVGGVAAFPAYGCGIYEQLCALQSHKACCFRIPLVPAYEYSETPHGCVDGAEAHVAGCEVEFLVVGGVVGDVHLAVFAGHASVCFEHDSCVVVKTRRTALEQGRDENYAQPSGERGVESYCIAFADVDGESAGVHILCLAEIQGVVQFAVDDETGTVGCKAFGCQCYAVAVVGGIVGVVLLYDACA